MSIKPTDKLGTLEERKTVIDLNPGNYKPGDFFTVSVLFPNGRIEKFECTTFVIATGIIDPTNRGGTEPYPILNQIFLSVVPHPFVAFKLIQGLITGQVMPWWASHVTKLLVSLGAMNEPSKPKEQE